MRIHLRLFVLSIRQAIQLFIQNDPLRMCGATAFFTTFALPPILIILVQFLSFIIDPETIRQNLYINLSGIVGTEAVVQIGAVIRAFREITDSTLAFSLGFLFLLFVATTLFKVIHSSIHQLWSLEKPDKSKSIQTLINRFKSFLIILLSGVLFIVGIATESFQVFISTYAGKYSETLSGYLSATLSFIFSLLISALWFLIIFRYITSHRPRWRIAWVGALFTSLLFFIGKAVLHVLLTYNNVTTFYGASASVVLLLLFVFYFSMILYFGAAFLKATEVNT
jgi:membrane protein